MARESNRLIPPTTVDRQPGIQYGAKSYTTPSSTKPAPIDNNGMPMLSNKEVGPILNYSPGDERRAGYEHSLRQYKVYKDDSASENSAATGQGARTWFSHEDVVNHLGKLAEKDPAKWGDKHKFHSKMLKSAKARIEKDRKAGKPVHSWENQPHPGNKDIHKRYYAGTREYTSEAEDLGFYAPSEDSPQARPVYSSDLKNPVKHGKMKRGG